MRRGHIPNWPSSGMGLLLLHPGCPPCVPQPCQAWTPTSNIGVQRRCLHSFVGSGTPEVNQRGLGTGRFLLGVTPLVLGVLCTLSWVCLQAKSVPARVNAKLLEGFGEECNCFWSPLLHPEPRSLSISYFHIMTLSSRQVHQPF